ncbi:MAG TPA: hypothetical protein VFG09_00910 [Thermodesulfovibrionales bacterium]|jgi:hypothetical protein|nr:hypothetical protein [Thermodesulfovibrionales bacterium]
MTGSERAKGVPEGGVLQKEQIKTMAREGGGTMEAKTGFAGFDIKSVNENALKMVKFSLDTAFDSVTRIQELNDRLVGEMINANKQILAGAEKIMGDWIENGRKGWEEYRKVMQEGFLKMEERLKV